MARRSSNAFAIWITGLPASGKSTLAACIAAQLEARGIDVAVLESDALRRVFVRESLYGEQERDAFYAQMAYVGALLTEHGVPVIFDATANRRRYRDQARKQIPRFLEIYVATSLKVCMARDPKHIYQRARAGEATQVPGLQAPYEPPESPDVTVDGERERTDLAAARVLRTLELKGYLEMVAGSS